MHLALTQVVVMTVKLPKNAISMIRILMRPNPALWGTGLLFSAGLAMLYGADFVLASSALAVAAVWGIGAWLVSKEVQKRKPKPLIKKTQYAKVHKYNRDRQRYLLWKFSIPALIVIVWFASACTKAELSVC